MGSQPDTQRAADTIPSETILPDTQRGADTIPSETIPNNPKRGNPSQIIL